jgi:hypothetical protein
MSVVADVCALNLIGDPFLYRIRLTGLVALYGRNFVQQILVNEAAKGGVNVVSIATSSRWRQSRKRQREDEAA